MPNANLSLLCLIKELAGEVVELPEEILNTAAGDAYSVE